MCPFYRVEAVGAANAGPCMRTDSVEHESVSLLCAVVGNHRFLSLCIILSHRTPSRLSLSLSRSPYLVGPNTQFIKKHAFRSSTNTHTRFGGGERARLILMRLFHFTESQTENWRHSCMAEGRTGQKHRHLFYANLPDYIFQHFARVLLFKNVDSDFWRSAANEFLISNNIFIA